MTLPSSTITSVKCHSKLAHIYSISLIGINNHSICACGYFFIGVKFLEIELKWTNKLNWIVQLSLHQRVILYEGST